MMGFPRAPDYYEPGGQWLPNTKAECFFRVQTGDGGESFHVLTPVWRSVRDHQLRRSEYVTPPLSLAKAEAVAAWLNEVIAEFRDEHRTHIAENWRQSYSPLALTRRGESKIVSLADRKRRMRG